MYPNQNLNKSHALGQKSSPKLIKLCNHNCLIHHQHCITHIFLAHVFIARVNDELKIQIETAAGWHVRKGSCRQVVRCPPQQDSPTVFPFALTPHTSTHPTLLPHPAQSLHTPHRLPHTLYSLLERNPKHLVTKTKTTDIRNQTKRN